MSDLLPEKIWYQHRTEPHNLPSYNAPPAGLDTVEYIRSDLMDAKIESLQRENEALKARVCSEEQFIGDKSLAKADSLPPFLRMPTSEAVEVFQAAFDNHTDPVPFDGRLIPNQWLLNETGITAKVAADFEAKIESLQRENEELKRIASEKHDEVLALEAAAITPEMREILKRAFALAREIEDRELAEDLCGLLGEQR